MSVSCVHQLSRDTPFPFLDEILPQEQDSHELHNLHDTRYIILWILQMQISSVINGARKFRIRNKSLWSLNYSPLT